MRRAPTFHLGIDPGKSGALVLLSDAGAVRWTVKMPATEQALAVIMAQVPKNTTATLEKVWAMPKFLKGSVANFSLGQSYGTLRAMLTAYGIPFKTVAPIEWQNAIRARTGGDKNVSKRRAAALWPGVKVTHAIADALLIAECGRRLEHASRTRRTRSS